MQSFGFTGGNSSDDVVFGEVNGDGYPDFAAAHEYGTVYLGDGGGDGGFILGDGNLPPSGLLGRYGPDLGDVENDGCQDLSFCNGSGGVEVWRWAGGEEWQEFSGSLPQSGQYEPTQLADMDMDGNIDVAAFGGNLVTVWAGDGMGGWIEVSGFNTASRGAFAAFRTGPDVDRNGRPDITLVSDECNWLNSKNTPHFFYESSEAAVLSIKPVYPRGNERMTAGSTRFIEWVSAVPGGEESSVRLELSLSGSSGPWFEVASGVPDNGYHQLTIPTSIVSDSCHLRYTVITASDTASGMNERPFSVVARR